MTTRPGLQAAVILIEVSEFHNILASAYVVLQKAPVTMASWLCSSMAPAFRDKGKTAASVSHDAIVEEQVADNMQGHIREDQARTQEVCACLQRNITFHMEFPLSADTKHNLYVMAPLFSTRAC